MNQKKRLRFKKFNGNVDSVDYDDLDNYDDNYDFTDDDEYRKIGSVTRLFKKFDKLMIVLTGEKLITQNIRAEEINMKIYHQKNISI